MSEATRKPVAPSPRKRTRHQSASPDYADLVVTATTTEAALSASLAQFKEVFGSLEETRTAAAGNAKFVALLSAMAAIKDGDTATLGPLLKQMLLISAILGPNGELQRDQNGQLVTDGSVGRFMRTSFRQRLELFGDQFVEAGFEEGKIAIDILMEEAGFKPPYKPEDNNSPAENTEKTATVATPLQNAKQEQANAKEFEGINLGVIH
jgi:hypothetical protein